MRSSLAAAAILLAGACGGGEDTPEVSEWMGTAPHVRVVGSLNDENIDIDLSGADAADVTKVTCSREYEVPVDSSSVRDYANGSLIEVKIEFAVGDRKAELELKKHDFQSDAVGTVVTIVPRSDTEDPAATQMWFEWEWHDSTDATVFEEAAQTGTFTLAEFSGTPDSTGLLIPDDTGTVGGFLHAEWSQTEQIDLSFTVKCGPNSVEEVM